MKYKVDKDTMWKSPDVHSGFRKEKPSTGLNFVLLTQVISLITYMVEVVPIRELLKQMWHDIYFLKPDF